MLSERPRSDLREAVRASVRNVMRERSLPPKDFGDDDKLGASLGLRSLDLAHLVFELELTFDCNPFAGLVPITSIRTVGDLAAAFELALGGIAEAGAGVAAELEKARLAEDQRRQRRGLA